MQRGVAIWNFLIEVKVMAWSWSCMMGDEGTKELLDWQEFYIGGPKGKLEGI